MQVYHGFKKEEFVIEKHINSRYGFPCLFFSDNIQLAKNYSAKSIIKVDVSFDRTIDFENKISHSPAFRNLIYSLRNDGVEAARIKNVYDRPDDNFSLEKGDIYVVFNFQRIKIIETCTR